MNVSSLRIAVLGAGIGGLAVARALALHGADVCVLEQAGELREVGAGLQVTPNGMAVLRGLGLDRALAATGAVPAGAVSLRDAAGPEVLRLDLAGHGAGDAYLCAHRADLHAVLLDGARAAGVRLHLLHRATEIHPGPMPEVLTRSGARVRADLVIGADGIHSVVRPALNGAAAPQFTGQVAWRALVPEAARCDGSSDPDRTIRLWMGPGRHLVSYTLRGGTLRNIVAVEEVPSSAAEAWSQEGDPAMLRAAFDGFGPDVADLLRRVGQVHRWGLYRHPVAARWHGPGLALLGDAAHPTLPFMAQGANLALEDAWVLAAELAAAPNVDSGLARYAAARRGRAARVVAAASRNSWKYHLSFPPLRSAGHMALRLGGRLAPGAMVRQFDWIWRHDVTRGAVLDTAARAATARPAVAPDRDLTTPAP